MACILIHLIVTLALLEEKLTYKEVKARSLLGEGAL